MKSNKIIIVDNETNEILYEFDKDLWMYHEPAIKRLFTGIQPNMEFWPEES